MIKHTAEYLDKWIQVATIDCQYYKFIVFDKSTHKLMIIMTTWINWEGMLAKCTVSTSITWLTERYALLSYCLASHTGR